MQARFASGATFFSGIISGVGRDHCYAIDYTDGTKEARVHYKLIRMPVKDKLVASNDVPFDSEPLSESEAPACKLKRILNFEKKCSPN